MEMRITRAKDVDNADFRRWYVDALRLGLTYRQFTAKHNITNVVMQKHLEVLQAVVPEMANYPLPRRLSESKQPTPSRKTAPPSIDPRNAKIRTNFATHEEADDFLAQLRQAMYENPYADKGDTP